MRKISEKEKQVIRQLVDGASNSFTYQLMQYGDIFHRERVEFVLQPNSKWRFYSRQGILRNANEMFSVADEL